MTLKKTKDVPKAQRKWVGVNLAGSVFHNVNLTGTRIRGAFLVDMELSGFVQNLTVNGIDVGPLIRAELEKKYPEWKTLRRGDPEGLREAWALLESMWAKTVARARRLGEERLHEQVDHEWSFVETLRHLVFVTDAWFSRAVLGATGHFWPAGMPNDDGPEWAWTANGLDRRARPSLAEALAVRRERMKAVRDYLAEVTEGDLDRKCRRNKVGGYPADPSRQTVRQCLQIVIAEEWEHHSFAVRDLERLRAR